MSRLRSMLSYWHLPVLAAAMARIGWNVRTSPYQVLLANATWFALYASASLALMWHWVRPSASASRLAVLLVAGVALFRGLVVWIDTGQEIALDQGVIVFVLVTRVYQQSRGRGWAIK